MARNPLSPFRPGGLTERGFGDPFLSLHQEMNRLFDDVLRGRLGGPLQRGTQEGGMMMPDIDVSETENEVRICAELPGVKDEDVDVSLNDDTLTIRAEKKFERKDEKENYHFMERSYGTFQRSLRLPYSVDADKIRADFADGVLTVTLPKGPEQEKRRKIQVQHGGRLEPTSTTGSRSKQSEGQQPGKSGKT
ncbi:heat shock protein 16 (plasmid) [Sinorhizobium fredii NGR234]|uniref:Heat shock protein 16 n=1 Tax=Sinorhizobium fredii (strain NBRC 101917 / NGR234) TaxID=394 RepID=C3KLU7_SINFN|nr:Hsp20/alpha crystallin family protein [Sinorhizobium fredii]ACP23383.1 heat shock protein 16 [Sinorhizobium fredii NGR234]